MNELVTAEGQRLREDLDELRNSVVKLAYWVAELAEHIQSAEEFEMEFEADRARALANLLNRDLGAEEDRG